MIFYPCSHIKSACSFIHAQPYWISHSVVSHHNQVGSQACLPPDSTHSRVSYLFTCTQSLPLSPEQHHWLRRTFTHKIASPNYLLYFLPVPTRNFLTTGCFIFLSLWREQRKESSYVDASCACNLSTLMRPWDLFFGGCIWIWTTFPASTTGTRQIAALRMGYRA